ncbi:MAG TPA: hypothetical protein VMU88_08305 [bacterium]|nr:hypothetical protein [bacterium]
MNADSRAVLFSNPLMVAEFLFSTTMAIIVSMGLYLYAYNKRWLPLAFWKIFAVFYLFESLIVYFYLHTQGTGDIISGLAGLLALVPAYIALFRYSFRKKHAPDPEKPA